MMRDIRRLLMLSAVRCIPCGLEGLEVLLDEALPYLSRREMVEAEGLRQEMISDLAGVQLVLYTAQVRRERYVAEIARREEAEKEGIRQ